MLEKINILFYNVFFKLVMLIRGAAAPLFLLLVNLNRILSRIAEDK